MKKILSFILILISTFFLKSQDTTSVLFIGNSFTFVGDLPTVFSNLSIAGGKTVYVESSTFGGYTLQMHSQNATTLQKINSRNWDFVVLQEQSQIPSFIPEREYLMYPYARYLDSIIHSNYECSKTIFFLTWAHKNGDLEILQNGGYDTYEDMQQRLYSGYKTIADSLFANISPCGWVCRTFRQHYPSIELYSSDDYHPGANLTYLAACTFYSTIFQESSVGLQANIQQDIALFIQNTATSVVLDSLSQWNINTFDTIPTSSFSYLNINDTIFFTNNSTNANSYTWIFGDGQISSIQNPSHFYPTNGTYNIKLIAYNACFSDTTEIAINNNDSCYSPIIFNETNISKNSATLHWSNFAQNYKVWILNNNSYYDCSTDSIIINSLECDSTYFYKVKSICNMQPIISSEWSLENSFTTLPCENNVIDFDNFDLVSIYPNPLNEYKNITISANNENITNITLFDFLGNKFFDKNILKASSVLLDFSNYKNGLYLIKITTENKNSIFRKLIINR